MHLCLYIARKEPGHSRAAEAEAAKRSRAKKREAISDPEVIRQFGTAVAAASVPSTSGGSTKGTVVGAEAVTGEPTAPGEPVSTAPGPSGSASSAGTGKSSIVRVLLGVVRRHESRFCCCIHSTPCTDLYDILPIPLRCIPSGGYAILLGIELTWLTSLAFH